MASETTSNGSAYALELVDMSVHYGGAAALDGADIGVRFVILDSGKLLASGEVEDVLNRLEVIEAYMGV